MTYQYPTYDRQKLYNAVHGKDTYTFTLGTADLEDLGVKLPNDQAQIRDGGRFDLTPWRKNPPRPSLLNTGLTPREILLDASQVAGHLFLQLEPSGGPDGMGEISATYNPMETPTLRVVHVEPV